MYYAEIRQADAAAAGPATEYEFSIVTGLCRADLYEPDNTADERRPPATPTARGSPATSALPMTGTGLELIDPAAGWYTVQTADLAPGSDTLADPVRHEQNVPRLAD